MSDDRVIKPNHRIAARVVDGQALILDPRTDELQRLNEVGSFIWSQIALRTQTADQIQFELVKEFKVDDAQAARDLGIFLDKLTQRDLISYTSD
jgi:hypothetical protein